MTSLIVLLVLVLAILFWGVGAYNRLVSLRNQFGNAFAQIDVQLKRRYDLVPNLVETARAYLKHERETLEAVVAARSRAVDANARMAGNPSDHSAMQSLANAEQALDNSLGRLMVLVEAYPELRASESMAQLAEELTSTENRIAFSRQGYNDSVMQYNIATEQFPGSVIASMFAFRPAELLQATEGEAERKPVTVRF